MDRTKDETVPRVTKVDAEDDDTKVDEDDDPLVKSTSAFQSLGDEESTRTGGQASVSGAAASCR